jgi:P27 family predicted phage terminase small subunit
MLEQIGVLTEADLPALEMLCLHYAVARTAYEVIEEDGVTTETDQGSLKKHPATSVFRENSLAFKGYLTEFGLTPASRVRLKIEYKPNNELSLADLLFQGANRE